MSVWIYICPVTWSLHSLWDTRTKAHPSVHCMKGRTTNELRVELNHYPLKPHCHMRFVSHHFSVLLSSISQNQNSGVNLCKCLRLDRHSSTKGLQDCKASAKLSYLHPRFLLSLHFPSMKGLVFGQKVTDVTKFICLSSAHCLSWDQIVLYITDRPAINIRDKSKLFCLANHILNDRVTDVWMSTRSTYIH